MALPWLGMEIEPLPGGDATAVLKDQDLSAASAFPARSLTPPSPPLSVAVYVALGSRFSFGSSVAFLLAES